MLVKMMNINCELLDALYLDELNCMCTHCSALVANLSSLCAILLSINSDALHQHSLPLTFSKRVVRDTLF